MLTRQVFAVKRAGGAVARPVWFGRIGKLMAAIASTGAACVSIMSFLYSHRILKPSDDNAAAVAAAAWVGLLPAADTAESVGDTLHLAATIADKNGSVLVGVRPKWSSSDRAVAAVGRDGSVIVRGPGTTVIVAKVGDLSARARIVVRQRVASVQIAGDSGLVVPEGERQILRALPLDARGHAVAAQAVEWRADDTSVVAVDSLGGASGLSPGRTIVSATVEGVAAHAPVTVVPAPAALAGLAGQAQRAPAGSTLPQRVVVRVTSRRGRPIEGVMVRFRTADGRGATEPGAALTDADGRARAAWTLGDLPGRQTLLATVDRVDSALAVAAEADPVARNTRVSPLQEHPSGAAGAPLGEPLGVRVTDSTGRALSDVPLSWAALDGGAVEPLAARTDSLGEARARWTLGARAGSQRVRVQVGIGRDVPPLTVQATALAGAPTRATVMSGDGQRGTVGAALARAVAIRVADAAGNPVAGVALTLAPAAGSVADSVVRTDSTGLALVRWVLGRRPGAHAMTVRVEGLRAPLRLAARAEPATPANLSFERAPAEGRAGRQLGSGITAVVTDVYGNPVPDAAVSFATRSGTVSPARAVSDARGRVQAKWTLGAKDGEQVLTGSVRGTDVKSTLAVQVAAAAPAPSARSGDKGSARAGAKTSTRTNANASAKTTSKTGGKSSAGPRARGGSGV